MSEINKDPQEVRENVAAVLASGDKPISYDDLLTKLDEIKKKSLHLFERLDVNLLTKDGAAVLSVMGVRKESKEELDVRVAKEEAKHKTIEDVELKEYLRLKKKFGKNRDE